MAARALPGTILYPPAPVWGAGPLVSSVSAFSRYQREQALVDDSVEVAKTNLLTIARQLCDEILR